MTREKCGLGFLLMLSVALVIPVSARAQSELTGRQIMEKVLVSGDWKDMRGDLVMILTNARGQVRKRHLKFFSKKRSKDETMMLMRFVAPADVKGTGFLVIEHKDRDDDRYLYLPALRRVNRITASGRGGNFMGSDFSYYDIGRPKLDDWVYKRLKDAQWEGKDCYVVQCDPATEQIRKDTRYSKIIRWIRKDIFTTVYAEYYDKDGDKWKELRVPETKHLGGVWFATHMIMKDIQIDHTSEMRFENLEVNVGLPDRIFTVRYLQRGL